MGLLCMLSVIPFGGIKANIGILFRQEARSNVKYTLLPVIAGVFDHFDRISEELWPKKQKTICYGISFSVSL